MNGPGEYVRDVTEGLAPGAGLPPPRLLGLSRNYPHRPCPRCHHAAYRVRSVQRRLHEVGDLVTGCPQEVHLTYSQHHCPHCGHYFHAPLPAWILPGSRYTRRVITLAVRLVVEDGLPYRVAAWHLWRDHRVFVPFATLQNWVEAGGKKSGATSGIRLSSQGPAGLLGLCGRR